VGTFGSNIPQRTVYPFDSQYQPVVSKANTQLQGDMLPGTSKLTDVSASIDYKGKRSTEGSDCVKCVDQAEACKVTFAGDLNGGPHQ